jgi:hypothetical protein
LGRNTLTVIAAETLGNLGPLYLKDVISFDIPELGGRVNKSRTVEDLGVLPEVIIDANNLVMHRISLYGTLFQNKFTLLVDVYASNMKERDSISDKIMALFRDPLSADSNGDTLRAQGFETDDIRTSVDDFFVQQAGKVKNIKARTIDIDINYVN